MPFLGTIVNVSCVIVFSIVGALIGDKIPKRINDAIHKALGVCAIYIGITGAIETSEAGLDVFFGQASLTKFLIMMISLVLGTVIGEAIDIDGWIKRLVERLENRIPKGKSQNSDFARGFICSTIIICTGAMAVNGAILDAFGDPEILIAKSVMDAVTVIVMSSAYGIGCAFSAIPLLLWQGLITLAALLFESVLSAASIYYLSVTGSLIMILMGTNIIGATDVKTANMTPALFIPLVLTPLLSLL